jgi:cobalt/nickel transport system ATP-binding protein
MAGFVEKNIAAAAGAIERSVASERWCRERGFLQVIDPRIKIISIAALLVACSLARGIVVLAALYALATVLALLSRIALGSFTRRVWIFIPLFTGIIAIPALFITPGEPIASFGPFVVTLEGAKTALILLLRVSGSVSFSILLVLTTPWDRILAGLRGLKVPALVTSLISLSYRYLLLLLRTVAELFIARKSRIIAPLPLAKEIGFVSRSGGFLFLKSLHLAEGVHMAMVSRGFDGEEPPGEPRKVERHPDAARRAAEIPRGHEANRGDTAYGAQNGDPQGRLPLEAARSSREPVFELEKVAFAYPGGIPGIAVEKLSIARGRCTVLLGPNGSGKSTLLEVLDGLLFPQSGVVRALGTELSERVLETAEFRRFFRSRVGLLFQDADVQCFSPTVREELAFGPRQKGLDEREVARYVDAGLAALGIEDIADRYPYNLSGGEKKRVAIASILTVNLDVYLLDEPTANLDPATEGVLIDILAGLAENGKTLVMATQDLVLAQHIGDEAVVLGRERRPVFIGPIEAALSDTALLEEAGLAHGHRHPHRRIAAGIRHSHYTEDKKP